jgi:hypothetical protein
MSSISSSSDSSPSSPVVPPPALASPVPSLELGLGTPSESSESESSESESSESESSESESSESESSESESSESDSDGEQEKQRLASIRDRLRKAKVKALRVSQYTILTGSMRTHVTLVSPRF